MDLEEASSIMGRAWSRDARVWEEYWTPIFRTFARHLVHRAGLRPGVTVLDVGCGTGLATFLAARAVEPGGSVLGIDRAPGMLRMARDRAARADLENTSFRLLDATHLDLPRGAFQRAISNCGIANAAIPVVLKGIHRILSPGGRFSFSSWFAPSRTSPGARLFGPLEDLMPEYRSEEPGPQLVKMREAREILNHWGRPHGSNQGVVRAMRRAGFEEVHHTTKIHGISLPSVSHFLDACLSMSYRRSELRAMGSARAREFRERAQKAYLSYERRGRMMLPWPMTYFGAVKP